MILKKEKFYYQRDFIKDKNNRGTCMFTSLFSCYPNLFDNDKNIINTYIKNRKADYIETIKMINEDIKNRLGFDNVIKYQIINSDTFSINCIKIRLAIKNPIIFSIVFDISENLPGHSVEVIGYENNSVYYIENGDNNELIYTIVESNKLKTRDQIEKLIKDLEFKVINDTCYSISLEKLSKYIKKYMIIWADTTNKKVYDLIHFTNKLHNIRLDGFCFDYKRDNVELNNIIQELIDEHRN